MHNGQQEHDQQEAAGQEDGKTREFRSHCRRFYRQSTSVHQSSSSTCSLTALEDAAAAAGAADDTGTTNGRALSIEPSDVGNIKEEGRECRVVVEALERLVEQSHAGAGTTVSPYATFLSAQPPSNIAILSSCGLPTSTTDVAPFLASDNSKVLDELVYIRTQERKLAHEVKMAERYGLLRDLLVERSSDRSGVSTNNGHNMNPAERANHIDKGADDTAVAAFATTREDIRRIRRVIRDFVCTYHEQSIASHPLLAGMRKVIQMQLGSDRDAVVDTVVWTLDGAVLTEAVQTKKCGAGGDDAYVRDALGAILSFMVWIVEDKNNGDSERDRGEGGDSSSKPLPLTFAVNPSLSDRSLEKILEVLPKERDLHGRPTGKVVVGTRERTNIDGDLDEIDFCQQILKEAFSGLKLCCPR